MPHRVFRTSSGKSITAETMPPKAPARAPASALVNSLGAAMVAALPAVAWGTPSGPPYSTSGNTSLAEMGRAASRTFDQPSAGMHLYTTR